MGFKFGYFLMADSLSLNFANHLIACNDSL